MSLLTSLDRFVPKLNHFLRKYEYGKRDTEMNLAPGFRRDRSRPKAIKRKLNHVPGSQVALPPILPFRPTGQCSSDCLDTRPNRQGDAPGPVGTSKDAM